MKAYPVNVWPLWMEGPDGLLAKSRDKSIGDEPESLAEHTWLVLSRLADQYQLRPLLVDQLNEPRLWHRMFWACFLHDFGKAAAGFQKVLRGKLDRWPQRHEVLSLAFIDWVFPESHPDRLWVIAAVASHHKEPAELHRRYLDGETAQEALETLGSEIDPVVLGWLWRWIDECAPAWAEALGMSAAVEFPTLLPLEQARAQFKTEAIRHALESFDGYMLEFEDGIVPPEETLGAMLLRGLIFTADHAASALIFHDAHFPGLTLTRADALPKDRVFTLNSHQLAAEQVGRGSALLVAPTGSGKTEAALLWAARQAALDGCPPPRLFYALPYQASMNAMQDRLASKHFPGNVVGLQHGRAVQSLYQDLLRQADDSAHEAETAKELAEAARIKRELADLGFHPIRVFSPYQMLKAAYSLKGFEALLTDYHGGLFIFDEIHAYEPKRLALIIELVRWLAMHYAARCLIMTATLPPTVEGALKKALPGLAEIRASAEDYAASRRHTVHLLGGDLLADDGLDRIAASVRAGQSTLVCLNTVQRAMQTFDLLRERLPDLPEEQSVLIHGRFNGKDRKRKEDSIIRHTGVNSEERRTMLVVSTQVVEVSLNIDLDVLYTDPAPLEALLQRFGRVNRGRLPGSPLADVYVFREPSDGQKVYWPELVDASLDALEAIDGDPVDEAQVSEMLRSVYRGDAGERWRLEYQQAAHTFRRDILEQIRPFHSADRFLAEQFYKLFDGVEALPYALEDKYLALRKANYVEASKLFVPVSFGQYKSLENKRVAWPRMRGEKVDYYIVDAPYDSERGLDLQAARERARAAQFETEDY